ncbi:BET1 homolog [Acanthaster planci]|uniref:BET1 homolog n=1 Tax=Acanthaster planci TaxID=133434 RepID=A0A8B7YV64_ACAPL|nr:BET1 homolog [Acanthaster planci]XP_022096375.1 BET1 homolog [Acanthaster planci]XP_022096376.1 BET1 homolog [Acanthaster planci]XP_022096377.1 BET1 homolog [Acanthaster planci]
MRRAGLESGGSRTYADYNAVEDENERLVDSLHDKVSTLKSLSIDIGTEVREQNSFLKQLDDTFDSSGGLLSSTMGRLSKMARAGHNCYLCYLLLFSFFVFFVIYFIIRLR